MKFLHPQMLLSAETPDATPVSELLDAIRKAKWWLDVLKKKPNATIHVLWGTNHEDVPPTMSAGEMKRRAQFGMIVVGIKGALDE